MKFNFKDQDNFHKTATLADAEIPRDLNQFGGFDDQDLQDIMRIFDFYSTSKDKSLDLNFLKGLIFTRPDLKERFGNSVETYFKIFEHTTRRRNITFEEFIDLLNIQTKKSETMENLKYVFRLFDRDQNGYLSLKSLKSVAKELGESVGESELLQMIEWADMDIDGKVTFEDFYYMFVNFIFT